MSESSRPPYPPFELANRVGRLPSNDLNGYLWYEGVGRDTKAELLSLLPDDFGWEGRRVLDFGCGAGRTLRQFTGEARRNEIWGVDIDAASIEWMRGNLAPPLHVATCEPEPPLPFADGTVDFAWAISVFTHLVPETSARWLLELHRVLKPGGLLMASYMGRWNSEVLADEPWEEDRVGMNVIQHDRPWEHGGPMVLMSDWWVEEHWGRAFELVGRTADVYNQTWPLLRKRDVTLSAEELLEPGNDPREWRALRHNVTQLQREVETTAAGAGWRRAAAAPPYVAPTTLAGRAREKLRGARRRLRARAS
jgi:SAM-dependent methyltransferase